MANILYDSFTDTTGTLQENHAPDFPSGATWINSDTSGAVNNSLFSTLGGILSANAGAGSMYHSSVAHTSDDIAITIGLKITGGYNPAGEDIYVYADVGASFRLTHTHTYGDAKMYTGYRWFYRLKDDTLHIERLTVDTSTPGLPVQVITGLKTVPAPTPLVAGEAPRLFTVTISGTTDVIITIKEGETVLTSHTDSSANRITTGKLFGVRMKTVAGNNPYMDSYSADTYVPAGGGDTIAPTVNTAAVANSTPTIVAITASETLDGAYVPAASAFTVTGHTVSSVAVSAAVINLTVTPAFTNGEAARTVSYTPPGTNNIRDAAGNQMLQFTNQAITNNVAAPGDSTPPAFSSAQVTNSQPSVIQVTMNETLAASIPPNSAFTVSGGRTVSSVSISGAVVSITVNTAYANGDTITVAYTQPGSNPRLQDATGNATTTFSAQSVTNNISPSGTQPTFTPTPVGKNIQGGLRTSIPCHVVVLTKNSTPTVVGVKSGLTATNGVVPPFQLTSGAVAGTEYLLIAVADADLKDIGTFWCTPL